MSRHRAGDSSPFGPDVLRLLHGRPWVVTAVDALLAHPALRRAGVVVAAPDFAHADVRAALRGSRAADADVRVVDAGATVHASVHTAIDSVADLPGDVRCVVHDVCRPLVSEDMIAAVIAASDLDPDVPVVPVLPLVETVKAVDANGRVTGTLDRGGLVRVQTPQAASLAMLRETHRSCPRPFTDRPNLVGRSHLLQVVPGEDRAELVVRGRDGDAYASAWSAAT